MQNIVKTVFVTGASSGIGLSCCQQYIEKGFKVIAAARRIDRLNSIKDALLIKFPKAEIFTLKMDVSDRKNVIHAISQIPETFKNVDILINNAGGALGKDLVEDVPDDFIVGMIDVNVKGLLYVTQAILPGMKSRQSGHIVNIGSIAGLEAYAGGSVYCATKHAVDAITNSLRIELVDTPINVSIIHPGMVETEFSLVRFGDQAKADSVYKNVCPLTADDIAETVVFITTRKRHVQISSLTIFPTCQATATTVSRTNPVQKEKK